MLLPQEMFDEIDKEEDGLIYIKDVLFNLKALSKELDQNKEVRMKKLHDSYCFEGALKHFES